MLDDQDKSDVLRNPSSWGRREAWRYGVIPAGVLLLALLLYAVFEHAQFYASLSEERLDAYRQLSQVRTSLDEALHNKILLVEGVAAYISTHPEITDEDFREFVGLWLSKHPVVRSMSLIRDSTISTSYPLEGNEASVGLDLSCHPMQAKGFYVAKFLREALITGPIRLVQGGDAMVIRFPVYLTEDIRQPYGGRYWGMVSLLVDVDTLARESRFEKLHGAGYEAAVQIWSPAGDHRTMMLGEEALFKEEVLEQSIELPHGWVRLGIRPRGGWGAPPVQLFWMRLLGIGSALLACFITFYRLRGYDELKRSREVLKAHEQRYRNLYHTRVAGLFRASPDGKRLLSLNDRCARMLGFETPEEVIARATPSGFFQNPEDWARMIDLLFKEGHVDRFTFPGHTFFGELRYFAITAHLYKNEGILEGLIEDVTEQKLAEDRLKAHEVMFRQIMENLPMEAALLERDGTLLWANSYFYGEEKGFEDKYVGQPLEKFVGEEPWSHLFPFVQQVQKGRLATGDLELVSWKGKPAFIRFHLIPESQESSGRHRFVLIGIDLTRDRETEKNLRLAKEKAEEATRAKSEFLAMMSHEIRTPMNGIIGFSEILSDSELSGEQQQWIQTVRSSAESLLHLINDILDLSKIESGKLELHPDAFNLKKVIEEASLIHRPRAREQQNDLCLRISDEVPEEVIGDAARLKQIISNLVSNAVKFTHAGEIGVEVFMGEKRDGKRPFELRVRDSGIGIPKEKQDTLFAPFTQVDASSSRKYEGSGLGLAICKRLIEAMGGSVHVSSEPGKGSEFVVELAFEESLQEASPSVEKETKRQSVEGIRALVVDDHDVNRELAKVMLDRMGVESHAVDSAEEMREFLKKTPVDVVFLDIQMPDEDGVQAFHSVRGKAEYGNPKIVALTAFAMNEDQKRFMSEGMDGYLSKPIKPDRIFAELKRLFS